MEDKKRTDGGQMKDKWRTDGGQMKDRWRADGINRGYMMAGEQLIEEVYLGDIWDLGITDRWQADGRYKWQSPSSVIGYWPPQPHHSSSIFVLKMDPVFLVCLLLRAIAEVGIVNWP